MDKLIFKEVDAGFYMGFIESWMIEKDSGVSKRILKDVLSQNKACEERWCICDPKESYLKTASGLFDTYITLESNPNEIKFLGSFYTFSQAEKHLNLLFQQEFKFETVPVFENEYYNSDYSEKKQSIFV